MENFTTLTQILRDKIKDEFIELKEIFYNDIEEDEFDQDIEDENEEDLSDLEEFDEDEFNEKVYGKLMNSIQESKYKKIIYLILLQDTYECTKSKEIAEIELYEYEKETLNLIENLNTNRLLNKINNDDEFYLTILTIYMDYQFELTEEIKQKNKKLLELTNDKTSKKFKINIIDDIQFQYTKTKKLY